MSEFEPRTPLAARPWEPHRHSQMQHDDCAHVWRYDRELDALVCTICGAVQFYPSHQRINCGRGGGHDA